MYGTGTASFRLGGFGGCLLSGDCWTIRTVSTCTNFLSPSLCFNFQPKQTTGFASAGKLLDVMVTSISRPTICQPRDGLSITATSVTDCVVPLRSQSSARPPSADDTAGFCASALA